MSTKHDCDCHECFAGSKNTRQLLDKTIRTAGFVPIYVYDANPPFVYTMGLTDKGLPEIILSGGFTAEEFNGLCMSIMPKLVSDHAKTLKTMSVSTRVPKMIKVKTSAGQLINAPIKLGEVHVTQYSTLFGKAIDRYGMGNFRVVQLFVPDQNGKLEGDIGFDEQWNIETAKQYPLDKHLY